MMRMQAGTEPDHVFVPQRPEDRYGCRHVVGEDAEGRPVWCNLARRYHPLVGDERWLQPPQRSDQP